MKKAKTLTRSKENSIERALDPASDEVFWTRYKLSEKFGICLRTVDSVRKKKKCRMKRVGKFIMINQTDFVSAMEVIP